MKLKITVISLSLLLLACSCSIFYRITGFKPESIRGMNYLQEAQTTEQMIDFIVYCYYVGEDYRYVDYSFSSNLKRTLKNDFAN